jgi:hypothetical protein
METLSPLASALGLGMLAGARLYLTVLGVGLLLRFHWIALPAAWQHASALADTRVLIASGVACAIEFIADKIPWVDSAWDSIHTFIRPVGAALMATSLFSSVDPAYQVLLFLLAGGMALSGHSAKAATRLAVNHSPEPFTNIGLSLVEDASVAGGLFLLAKYPWVLAGFAVVFLALFLWLAPRIYRALRAEGAAISALFRHWFGDVRAPVLTAPQQSWLNDNLPGQVPRRLLAVIATADLKGLRTSLGTLCLIGHETVFFPRKRGREVARPLGLISAMETRRGLLLDELLLVAADGHRIHFDLLAGQLQEARDEARRISGPATA